MKATHSELRQTSLFDQTQPPSGPRSRSRFNCEQTEAGAPREATPHAIHDDQHLRFADIFAGIGGFHLAFERAGGHCVFAAENDGNARVTYEANFAGRNPDLFTSGNFASDIAQVPSAAIPDHDVLTAGFPCQPFSVAGNRHGFADERGIMFYHLARILADKRPAAFVFENVAGLRLHDKGATFAAMRQTLTTQLGYSLHTAVLRACDFGLPQLRPRLFMVGFRDPDTPFQFPEPVPLETTMSDVLGGRCEREIGRTIRASGYGKRLDQKFNWNAYLVDGKERHLTPREAAFLQGFPPDFILSAAQRTAFKQIGNAVAVPVAAAVAAEVAASLAHTATTTSNHVPEAQR